MMDIESPTYIRNPTPLQSQLAPRQMVIESHTPSLPPRQLAIEPPRPLSLEPQSQPITRPTESQPAASARTLTEPLLQSSQPNSAPAEVQPQTVLSKQSPTNSQSQLNPTRQAPSEQLSPSIAARQVPLEQSQPIIGRQLQLEQSQPIARQIPIEPQPIIRQISLEQQLEQNSPLIAARQIGLETQSIQRQMAIDDQSLELQPLSPDMSLQVNPNQCGPSRSMGAAHEQSEYAHMLATSDAAAVPSHPPENGTSGSLPSPSSVDDDIEMKNSPSIQTPSTEKHRSRRKPTLEDIVRRMKEESYCSEESEEEHMNGSLTIDTDREDVKSLASDNRENIPLSTFMERKDNNHLELPIPDHTKFTHTALDLLASHGGDTAFPHPALMPSKLNGWLHNPFNGMRQLPFPSHPVDRSLAARYLPVFANKFSSGTEGEKDYLKCQYCERTFRRQKNLENHIENTHHGKGQVRRKSGDNMQGDMYFKCTHCPYTTKHQSNLYVHLRIHTGERPYICGACGVQYSQSHSLKSHIINKHDGIMSYYIKEKRNRSPRGLSYMTSQVAAPDLPMFKLPRTSVLGQSLTTGMDLSSKFQEPLKASLVEGALSQLKSSPSHALNGHSSPHCVDILHNHIHAGFAPSNHLPLPYQSSRGVKLEPINDACLQAIDLSKKSTRSDSSNFGYKQSQCAEFKGVGGCLHGEKLRMLRMNVVRMLSILVPNLNFEEKGISAEGDSVDELLQDVIESNTQDDDMSE